MPTLYLNGDTTEARRHNRGVEVTRIDEAADDIKSMHVPFFDVERVVVVGQAQLSTPLIQGFARHGVPVHFTTTRGRWLGAFYPNANGHALRRLRQYDLARNAKFALTIAKRAVVAKIRNSRRVLQRLGANRDMAAAAEQLDACNTLLAMANQAEGADNLDSLRGCEGYAAAVYFKRISAFFPEELPFNGRNRRPPRDAANALMSWTYTIVLGEVDCAVRTAGLDPCLGFLHEISYGRPSLSLDLLEPLRPSLCDMLVLRLLNHKLLRPEHFEYHADDGGTYLSEQGRRTFFPEYERTMQRRFSPSKNASHTDFRNLIRKQVEETLRAMEKEKEPEFFLMP